jgi:hypothetical protein
MFTYYTSIFTYEDKKIWILIIIIFIFKFNCTNHGCQLFKISGRAQFCVTNSPSRQSQRIQNAPNNKDSAPKRQGMNGGELQCAHLPLLLLNTKDHLRHPTKTAPQITQVAPLPAKKPRAGKHYGKL